MIDKTQGRLLDNQQPDILSVSRQSLQSSHKKNTCNCGPAKTKDKEVDCM